MIAEADEGFRTVGFGDDLEMRSRLFACYQTWEAQMFPELSRKARKAMIESRMTLLSSDSRTD